MVSCQWAAALAQYDVKNKQTRCFHPVLLQDCSGRSGTVLVPAGPLCFLSMLSVLLSCLGACQCIPASAAVLVLNVGYLCVFLKYLCVPRAREEQHKPRRFILCRSPNISSNKAPFGKDGQIQSALSCTSLCGKSK